MKYNPKPYERLLSRYMLGQAAGIERLINEYIRQVVLQVSRVNPSSDKDFEFRDYPALSRAVNDTLRLMSNRITSTILTGSMWAWDLANLKNDDMIASIVRTIGASRIPEGAISRWSQKNLPALEAFQQRKIGGMNLSDKVWAYSRRIKGDLELALDLGIGEGKSADSLSRSVRQFLREPDRLYRRVRDEKGVLHLSKAASNYHPGQGVYRSSYKNAQRLAATETNMAYRTADHDRMQQMGFVLGIEIHLSNNHTRLNAKGEPEPFFDICDELQGRYPKDFIFKGWHPNCRCYVTSILPDKEEFFKYLDEMDENGNSSYRFKDEVTEMPENILDWMRDNEYRVIRAKTLPYWISDNPVIANSQDVLKKIVSVRSEDGNYPGLVSDLKKALSLRGRSALVAFDPVSAIVIQELSKRHELKDKIKLFGQILSDNRATTLHKSDNGARAVIFPGHKTKNLTWPQTQVMAKELVDSGRSLAFLPELETISSADALIKFKGMPTIADFKYISTTKANTLSLDLIDGFKQAQTLIIKLPNMDAGVFRDSIEYLKRNRDKIGNILLINKYGASLELSYKELKTNRYKTKIKGFL